MRILVTGASGLLGGYLTPAIDRIADGYPLGRTRSLDHPNFVSGDLADEGGIFAILDGIRPEVIVHAAALANVDTCETKRRVAYRENVQATRNLVNWARNQDRPCRIVYVSTDQVYDGDGPHSESAANPPNVYGMTKLWAEDLVRALAGSLVLRTNFFALDRSGAHTGFTEWLIGSLSRGEPITLFEDALFNPLYADDLAEIIVELIGSEAGGTYNLGASQGMSKAEFARRLASRLRLSLASAVSGSVGDVKLPAYRPSDLRTAVVAVEDVLKRPVPTIDDGISRLHENWQKRGE